MSELQWANWAEDEQTFWDYMVGQGVVELVDDRYVNTEEYQDLTIVTTWGGTCTRPDTEGQWTEDEIAAYEANGTLPSRPPPFPQPWSEEDYLAWVETGVVPTIVIDGFHSNTIVFGELADEMMEGYEQYNEDGTLKWLFDRTDIVSRFTLVNIPRNPNTRFPSGYQNPPSKVSFADNSDFTSPSNIILR